MHVKQGHAAYTQNLGWRRFAWYEAGNLKCRCASHSAYRSEGQLGKLGTVGKNGALKLGAWMACLP